MKRIFRRSRSDKGLASPRASPQGSPVASPQQEAPEPEPLDLDLEPETQPEPQVEAGEHEKIAAFKAHVEAQVSRGDHLRMRRRPRSAVRAWSSRDLLALPTILADEDKTREFTTYLRDFNPGRLPLLAFIVDVAQLQALQVESRSDEVLELGVEAVFMSFFAPTAVAALPASMTQDVRSAADLTLARLATLRAIAETALADAVKFYQQTRSTTRVDWDPTETDPRPRKNAVVDRPAQIQARVLTHQGPATGGGVVCGTLEVRKDSHSNALTSEWKTRSVVLAGDVLTIVHPNKPDALDHQQRISLYKASVSHTDPNYLGRPDVLTLTVIAWTKRGQLFKGSAHQFYLGCATRSDAEYWFWVLSDAIAQVMGAEEDNPTSFTERAQRLLSAADDVDAVAARYRRASVVGAAVVAGGDRLRAMTATASAAVSTAGEALKDVVNEPARRASMALGRGRSPSTLSSALSRRASVRASFGSAEGLADAGFEVPGAEAGLPWRRRALLAVARHSLRLRAVGVLVAAFALGVTGAEPLALLALPLVTVYWDFLIGSRITAAHLPPTLALCAAVYVLGWARQRFAPDLLYVVGGALLLQQVEARRQARALFAAESRSLQAALAELPAHMDADDLKSLQWINTAFAQLWPGLKRCTADTVIAWVQPLLQENVPSFLARLELARLDLGDAPITVTNVRADKSARHAVVWDIDFRLSEAEPDITLNVFTHGGARVPIRVQSLLVEGRLRLEFYLFDMDEATPPFWPAFNAISYTFVSEPTLEFSLSTMRVDVMNVPLLSSYLRKLIMDGLRGSMVLPHKLVAPDWRGWSPDEEEETLPVRGAGPSPVRGGVPEDARLVLPESVLCVQLLEGADLQCAARSLKLYCTLSAGGRSTRRSRSISDLAEPWDEEFVFFVDDPATQSLTARLYNAPSHFGDATEMGTAVFPLRVLSRMPAYAASLPLDRDNQGALRVKLMLRKLQRAAPVPPPCSGRLHALAEGDEELSEGEEEERRHGGALFVQLLECSHLSQSRLGLGPSAVTVSMTLGTKTKRSSGIKNSNGNPRWQSEVFSFFTRDNRGQTLDLRVCDGKLGEASIDVATAALGCRGSGSLTLHLPLKGVDHGTASLTLHWREVEPLDALSR